MDRATFKPKKFQFSYVTDKTWSSLIEQSSIGPVKSYSSLTTKHPSQFFSVALVSVETVVFLCMEETEDEIPVNKSKADVFIKVDSGILSKTI